MKRSVHSKTDGEQQDESSCCWRHFSSKYILSQQHICSDKTGTCRHVSLASRSFRFNQRDMSPLLKSFYDSVVAAAIFYVVVCWASSISAGDRKRPNRLIRRANILDFFLFLMQHVQFWHTILFHSILFYSIVFLNFCCFQLTVHFLLWPTKFPTCGTNKGSSYLILSYHTQTPLKNNWLHFLHIFNNHTIQSNIYLHIYKYAHIRNTLTKLH